LISSQTQWSVSPPLSKGFFSVGESGWCAYTINNELNFYLRLLPPVSSLPVQPTSPPKRTPRNVGVRVVTNINHSQTSTKYLLWFMCVLLYTYTPPRAGHAVLDVFRFHSQNVSSPPACQIVIDSKWSLLVVQDVSNCRLGVGKWR
jgi:hypothetical protein